MRGAEPGAPEPPGGAHVRLAGLRKGFGATTAVVDFSLGVPRGSFTTLLGPSGCGKTTVLRMVAGYAEPDAGRVLIGGADQTDRPPNLRGVGMVFQDYALFPHMSVKANVGYGLRMQRLGKRLRDERVARALNLLGLTDLGGRYPHQLSGGQQQRVALGRVLVLEPEVLLMDEPFSNLDARLRLHLRAELKALQRQLGITTIYVTHDQEEALSLSDQVVVMDQGRILQVGAPAAVYQRPANRFVAEFVGQANLLPVRVDGVQGDAVTASAAGQPLTVRLPDERRPPPGAAGLAMVRPEQVRLGSPGSEPIAGAWQVEATVTSRGFHGAFERCWLELAGVPEPWLVDVPLHGGAVGEAHGRRSSGPEAGGSAKGANACSADEVPEMALGTKVTVRLPAGAASWLW